MTSSSKRVIIDIAEQRMLVFSGARLDKVCQISTARNGVGNEKNSLRTPLGKHIIRAKIGAGLPRGAILRGRRWTGEIYDPSLKHQFPDRDWILTRIFWLCGCEPGINRFGSVDTMTRYIYIHGAPEDTPLGIPSSRGCIRVSNDDAISLFRILEVRNPVDIVLSAADMGDQSVRR